MKNFVWTTATSGDFSNAANWSPAGIPGQNDTVTISVKGSPYTVAISSNVDVASINVSSDDATVSLGGQTITAQTYSAAQGSVLSGFGTVAAAFQGSGDIVIQGGTMNFTVADDVFLGDISGSGTLEISASATLLSTSVTVANVGIQGAGVVLGVDDEMTTLTGNLTLGAGATINIVANLVVSGDDTFNGVVDGLGTLTVSGGQSVFAAGSTFSADELLETGGSVAFQQSVNFGGSLQQTGGQISIALDDMLTLSGDDTFGGAVTGAGGVTLAGFGSLTLDQGATLSMASLTVGDDDTVNALGNVSFNGLLYVGGTLDIGVDDTFTVGGAATFDDIVSGGTLAISAGGSAVLGGFASMSVAGLQIAAGGRLEIDADGFDATWQTHNSGLMLFTTSGGAFGGGNAFDDELIQGSTGIVEIATGAAVAFNVNPNGGAILFAPGDDEVLTVDDAAITGNRHGTFAFGSTIRNFSVGDQITLPGATITSVTPTFSGGNTILAVTTSINTLDFTLAGNYAGATFNHSSSGGIFGGDDSAITVSPLLTTPIFSGGGNTTVYYEKGSPVTIDAKLSINPGLAEIDSARVAISGGLLTGDTLDFSSEFGVFGTYSHGVLSLSGEASASTYASILDSIAFASSSADPTNGGKDNTRAITFTATSGSFTSSPVTTTIVIKPLPPTEQVAGSNGTFVEGGSPTGLLNNVVLGSNSQTDAQLAVVKIGKGFLLGDTLSFVGAPGIVGKYNAAKGLLILKGLASFAEYQQVLESVTFSTLSANPNYYGADFTRTLLWAFVAGGQVSNIVDTTIGVQGVDSAPTVLRAGDSVAVGLSSPATAIDSKILIADPDNLTAASATVAITGGFESGDTLSYSAKIASKFGVTVAYDSGTGVLTFTGSAKELVYEVLLETVTFSSTSMMSGDRTITWTVSDGQKSSTAATSTVVVAHDAPTLGGFANVVATYSAGGAPVVLDSSMTVSETGGSQITEAAVFISKGFVHGDTLDVTGADGVSVSYNAAKGLLVLTGAATVADYQALFDEVTFSSSPSAPHGGRALSWIVFDQVAGGPTLHSGIATTVVGVAAGAVFAEAASLLSPVGAAETPLAWSETHRGGGGYSLAAPQV